MMYRKTAKIGALLLVLTLLAGLLCGCHGSKGLNAFEMPEAFDTSRNYEITFWAKNDTNINQVNAYKKIVSDFEALYPNVKVNLRLYTDYNVIYNDVITNISTGTTPDVCITYPDHIATYMTGQNVVVPLDDLMDDPKYGLAGSEIPFDGPAKSELIGKFLEECRIRGRIYALPFIRSTEALYINQDFVKKLGYTVPDVPTWDWIWQVSEAATAKKTVKLEDGTTEERYAVNNQKVMIPFIYKSTDNMMISMLRQRNLPYSDETGNIEIFNEETKKLLLEVAKHSESGAFSTFKISSYPANFLNAGQCIFAIDSTAGATWMGSDAPLLDIPADSLVPFTTAVRPIPQFDPEHPQMISQGPSVCVFNKNDNQRVLAAWLFAQFLLTNDAQISYAKTEGYLPVTSKAQQDPAYIDYLSRAGELTQKEDGSTDNAEYYRVKIEASKLLMENTDNSFTTPVFNGSASLRQAAGQLIEEAAYAPRRKLTVDDKYLNETFEKIRVQFKLDQIGLDGVGRKELGPLPKTSVVLLESLAGAWILIAVFAAIKYNKSVRKG